MLVSEIGSATGAIKRDFRTARPTACERLALPSQRTMGPRRASLWRSSVGTASRWQSYTRKQPIKNDSPRAQCICSTRKIGINREQKCVPLPAPVGLFPRSTSKIKYIKNGWWAREDSNLQPSGYERRVSTGKLKKSAFPRTVDRVCSRLVAVFHWLFIGQGRFATGMFSADRCLGNANPRLQQPPPLVGLGRAGSEILPCWP